MESKDLDQISFFGEQNPWGEFSNFYHTLQPIRYKGKDYKTSEHLYQCLKFLHKGASRHNLEYAEIVREAKTPYMAKILAGQSHSRQPWAQPLNHKITKYKGLAIMRKDWEEVKQKKMLKILRLKFDNDEHCRDVLINKTQDQPLVEASPYDYFWGCGASGKGKNVLGKLLVQVRNEIRETRKNDTGYVDPSTKE